MATLTAYKIVKAGSFGSFYAQPPNVYTVGESVGYGGAGIGFALYVFDDEAYARAWVDKVVADPGGTHPGKSYRVLEVSFDDEFDKPNVLALVFNPETHLFEFMPVFGVEMDILRSTAKMWRVARLDVVADIT